MKYEDKNVTDENPIIKGVVPSTLIRASLSIIMTSSMSFKNHISSDVTFIMPFCWDGESSALFSAHQFPDSIEVGQEISVLDKLRDETERLL